MKINVHAGHTRQDGKSPGAGSKKTGIWESIEDRKIKDEVIKQLKAKGHTVYDCTDNKGVGMYDNLKRIVKKCNAHKVDLDVSIHLNCFNGNGHGTEVHVYSSKSKAKKAAERTVKALAKLGWKNRGVKVSNYYVLRETVAPAMLIETFFCDNAGDCKLYKKLGHKKIAEAIVKAVVAK